MTARWVVDAVTRERDLSITWEPISLLFKNEPAVDSDYYAGALLGHRCLRVMEAIRAEHGDGAVQAWYWQCATRIHHDRDRELELTEALGAAGFDQGLATAADDERWDDEIRARMGAGLELVGDDVGTPIIAFACDDGATRGIFGPVMTRVPDQAQSVRFWDAMVEFVTTDGFWELKRTRTEPPAFGPRPDV